MHAGPMLYIPAFACTTGKPSASRKRPCKPLYELKEKRIQANKKENISQHVSYPGPDSFAGR